MQETTILVIGGAGFLGGNVSDVLDRHGYLVRVFDVPGDHLEAMSDRGFEVAAGDCCDALAISQALDGVDAVFSLAAAPEYCAKDAHLRVTVGGISTLIHAMKSSNIKRLLYISSIRAKVHYNGHYGTSKAKAESIIKGSGLDFTIFRPGLLYGPGEFKLSRLIQWIQHKSIVPVVGDGQYGIFPVHAVDLAEAMATALRTPKSIGKTYDVVGSSKVNFNELTEMIADYFDKPIRQIHLPLWSCQILAGILSICTKAPAISVDQVRSVRAGHAVPDLTMAEKDLGFKPRSFEESLRQHIDSLNLR